jgi:hypothetical protein
VDVRTVLPPLEAKLKDIIARFERIYGTIERPVPDARTG